MQSPCDLEWWAQVSSVLAALFSFIGGVVGVWGYGSYRCGRRKKRKALEEYLKDVKHRDALAGKRGQRGLLHLVRHVGLTEDEILQLSFASPLIERRISADGDGQAESLYFEYVARESVKLHCPPSKG